MSDLSNDLILELLDREKIRDCMMRYAQAVDRLDMDLLKSVYWPDAHDWHGPYKGNAYEVFEAIFSFLRDDTVRTQHFLGASMIRFVDKAHAHVETYSQNFHTIRNPGGENYDFIHGGRYLDKMEKRGEEWRIIDRIILIEWVTQGAKPYDFNAGVLGSTDVPISERRPHDLIYKFLGDISALPFLDGRTRASGSPPST